ncbi:stationary-phase-induced ribosome-associated protein, partial [Escherichia coli]
MTIHKKGQARHILGLDHKISNQRKIVTEGDKS